MAAEHVGEEQAKQAVDQAVGRRRQNPSRGGRRAADIWECSLAARGVWDEKGQWLPVPYIDTTAAEKLFAHKIFLLIESKNLLSDQRMELLLSFFRQ